MTIPRLRTIRHRLVSAAVVTAVPIVVVISTLAMPAGAQTSSFGDVPDDAYFATPVADLHAAGVFNDTLCDEGFCPGVPIDRKTMAVWTIRVLDGQDPPAITQSRFDDVDPASYHAPFIERMAELEVTRGCGDPSRFCPDRNVTRAEMAAFLSRAFNLLDGPNPGFEDVSDGAWYASDVAKLAASGITVGCGANRFCPSRTTTRAEMATFLYRALNDHEDFVLDPLYPEPLYDGEFERDRSLELSVYYCGIAGSYTEDNLQDRVDEMNRIIGPFVQRQSEFQDEVTFVRGATNGGILSPVGIAGISDMRTFSKSRSFHLDCLKETGRPMDTKVVLLANVGSPGPNGYAPHNGPAVARTLEKRNNDLTGYMGTVAHEVLHAFYDLPHPWRTRTALCDEIEDKYDLTDIQQRDRDYCAENPPDEMLSESHIEHLVRSIMSYTMFGSQRDLVTREPDREAYVACDQRASDHLQWVDPDVCDRYRASAPGRPSSPRVRSAIEGLTISWSAPGANGADIDDYDVRYRVLGSEDWIDWPHDGPSITTTITGLTPNTTYRVSVRAVNRISSGDWSAPGEGMPSRIQTPEVILTRGASAQGEDCVGPACFWLHVEIKNFPPGKQTLACAHNGVHQTGFSRGVYHSEQAAVSNDASSTMDCFFGFPGNEVFVIVGAELRDGVWYGGTYSNELSWDGPPPPGIINDNPELKDEIGSYSWWRPPENIARFGYDGGFHFTLAIGNANDDELDNWAVWEFDPVSGRHEVQAWIPADWATAHAQYLIWVDRNGDGRFDSDEYVDGPWLNQQTTSGWQTLGEYDLNGRVRIEVRDVRARDDWNDVGEVNARLAVDAIQLVPSSTPPPPEVINDNPELKDEIGSYSWWRPPENIARFGYDGGFHFTLAIGNANDDELDNWAVWEFDPVSGRHEVQAWIPADWATAHAQYLIWVDRNGDGRFDSDEYVDGPWLNQQTTSGWQTLGEYDLNGRVRIEVRDVRARDDWNDVGEVNARLAVDAIRLVRGTV